MLERLAAACAAEPSLDVVPRLVGSAAEELAPGTTAAVYLRCPGTGAWQRQGDPTIDGGGLDRSVAEARDGLDEAENLLVGRDGGWHLPLTDGGRPFGILSLVAGGRSGIGAPLVVPLRALADLAAEVLRGLLADAGPAETARREAAWSLLAGRLRGASGDAPLDALGEALRLALPDAQVTIVAERRGDAFPPIAARAVEEGGVVVQLPNTTKVLEPDLRQAAALPVPDVEGHTGTVAVLDLPVRGRVYRDVDLTAVARLADLAGSALPHVDAPAADDAIDAATGLPAPSALAEPLAAALSAGTDVAVIVLALDDTTADDATASAIGDVLRGVVASDGVVACRPGPARYAVLTAGRSEQQVGFLAARLRVTLRHRLAGECSTTACAGLAFGPRHGRTVDQLLAAAEHAAATARLKGPDRDAVADERSAAVTGAAGAVDDAERLTMLRILARIVDEAHFGATPRSVAVSRRAERLAATVGLPQADVEAVALAGEFHAIGRTLVPRALFAGGTPNASSINIIRGSVVLGGRLIGAVGSAAAAEAVAAMHERWDGRGVPASLQGKQIPTLGRVLAVAAGFEAALAEVGRGAAGEPEALVHVQGEAGRAYEPVLVAALARSLTAGAGRHAA